MNRMEEDLLISKNGFELMDEEDYRDLIKKSDPYISIGDIRTLEQSRIRNQKGQSGFATGFVLGISAGVAFVICVIVLALVGVVKL